MYLHHANSRLTLRRSGQHFLFIHTPKCGGRFVEAAFGRARAKCPSLTTPDMSGHLTYLQYQKGFARNGFDFARNELVSLVRNPWSWHVSWYNYVRKDNGGRRSGMPEEHALFSRMSFIDYLRWLDDPLITGRPNQYYLNQISDWIVDDSEAIVVPHLLRQETLAEDLATFKQKFNLRIKLPSGRKNQSFKGDPRRQYCDEGIEIVARRHARDLDLFGYSFDSSIATSG